VLQSGRLMQEKFIFSVISEAIGIFAQTKTGGVKNISTLLRRGHDLGFLLERMPEPYSRRVCQWYLSVRIAQDLTEKPVADLCAMYPGVHNQSAYASYEAIANERAQGLKLKQFNPDEMVETRVLGGYTIDGLCMPSSGDVVFDVGTFNGNNSLVFSDMVGEAGEVHSFEPSPPLFEMATHNCSSRPNIKLYNVGLHSEPKSALMERREMASRITDVAGDRTMEIELIRLDDFVEDHGIARCDFIKMDIEGAEIPALRGAQKTISRFRPTMMIAAYHRPEDLFELPKLIDPNGIWYSFYLRHYHYLPREMILFAIPNRQEIPAWAR